MSENQKFKATDAANEFEERIIEIRRVSKVTKGGKTISFRAVSVVGNRDVYKRQGTIGDVVVCSVREAIPHTNIKKGQIVKAVIVRTKKEVKRKDGTYIRFDDNAAVLIDKNNQPLGTRVFGPVAREVREKGYSKIASLAKEVW